MSKSAIVALVFLLLGCSEDRLQAAAQCGKACLPEGILEVGICASGTWFCNGDGGLECKHYVGPQQEVCNGLDDDCDGVADDNMSCTVCTPRGETCDGADNDCDGMVDEIEDLPVQFCYDGPPETVLKHPCHPGIMMCFEGRLQCDNQQKPQKEACNGVDDNCNGVIDDGLLFSDSVDIVFVVDNSGSMDGHISNVRRATSDWVLKYSNRSDLRFALVSAPDSDTSRGATPFLYVNFGDAQALSNAMTGQTAAGVYEEATLGAIWQIANSTNPLGLLWTKESDRIVVIFTDEEPQYIPSPNKTINEVITAAANAGLVVHVFTVANVSPMGSSNFWYWREAE